MNLFQTIVADLFDLDALEHNRRIIASALLKFYMVVVILALIMVLSAQFVFVDGSYYAARMVLGWSWLVVLVVAISLTRKGYVLGSGVAVSAALMVVLFVDIWRAGGLSLLSVAAIMPLLLLTFLDARRAIFVCGVLITGIMASVHMGLHWGGYADHYPYHRIGALISFVMAMAGAIWITSLSARVTGQNMEDVAQRTRELELARGNEQLRRMEAEELGRASVLAGQAKSRFLSNMSHELRTPLNAILGYAEMLEEDLELIDHLGDDYTQDAVRIQHSAHHLLGLINDILDLSRLEAKKMPVREERITVEALLDEVVNRCHTYRFDTLEVQIAQEDRALMIEEDRVCLAQLIVQAVLECGGAGVLGVSSKGEAVELVFVSSATDAGEVTESLLELRELLREALVELLEVAFTTHEKGWSMRLSTR